MELFSSATDCSSHCIRFILAEKELDAVIRDADSNYPSARSPDSNSYPSLPTLVDRDLVLSNYLVIMEYLDERFPHPPLLPPDPISRARFRMALARINEDWYTLSLRLDAHLRSLSHSLSKSNAGETKEHNAVRKSLRDSLIAAASMFDDQAFFLNEEFSLLDCSLGPLLWRLPLYNIALPKTAQSIDSYAQRLFERASFQHSLTSAERAMRTGQE